MNQTFSQKLAYSFALLCVLTVITSMLGVYALNRVVESKDHIANTSDRSLHLAARLQTDTYRQSAAIRGLILSPGPLFREALRKATEDSLAVQTELTGTMTDQQGQAQIAQIAQAVTAFDQRLETIAQMQDQNQPMAVQTHYMVTVAMPQRLALETRVDDFVRYEQQQENLASDESTQTARRYRNSLIVFAFLVLTAAVVLAVILSRLLNGQIGVAVQEIQSSAAQLQSTASEQATGAREQATAMSEITTTMTELLTTSRQIADSSKRVAAFSRETADAARASDQQVDRAQDSLNAIRAQVDVIVNHMLDLGSQSQQIGGLVEIIRELAEQTNILAINAAIEAAGAGDSGRRFAVVAEEIRKLADRVAGSARQARGMVDDVRAAIHTTVMATESGSKAVDTGTRDFSEVTQSLDQILALVSTATEAAREIELSTKQQSTAVEQVNIAVSNVAQVARDVETSTTEASQTASQLARLSGRMAALIRQERLSHEGNL